MREETVFTGETEEARPETNEPAIMFGNRSGEIIVGDLASHATAQ
jgi:hypothetical protein